MGSSARLKLPFCRFSSCPSTLLSPHSQLFSIHRVSQPSRTLVQLFLVSVRLSYKLRTSLCVCVCEREIYFIFRSSFLIYSLAFHKSYAQLNICYGNRCVFNVIGLCLFGLQCIRSDLFIRMLFITLGNCCCCNCWWCCYYCTIHQNIYCNGSKKRGTHTRTTTQHIHLLHWMSVMKTHRIVLASVLRRKGADCVKQCRRMMLIVCNISMPCNLFNFHSNWHLLVCVCFAL